MAVDLRRWRYRARDLLSKLPSSTGWRRAVWVVVFASILSGALVLRLTLNERVLPYCRHTDEQHWTGRAIEILQTGNLNPERFTKPSVMVYLNAAGIALGLVRAGARGEAVYTPAGLGDQGGYPYYRSRTALSTLRAIYALLSVVSLLLATLIARRLSKSNVVALLALLLMVSSTGYLRYSWLYLNVDILGCFFAMATLAYLFLHRPASAPAVVAALGGVLSGLTLGTKYNLYPIVIPVLLWVVLYQRSRWFSLSVLTLSCMSLSFLLSTPYALLDLDSFVSHAAGEAHHYAVGHKGKPLSSGFAMTWRYLEHLLDSFSPLVLVFALYGLGSLLRLDAKRAAMLLAFPVVLLWYMSQQRAFFARNLVVLHLLLPIVAAVGMRGVYRRLLRLAETRIRRLGARRAPVAAALLIGISLVATTPWSRIVQGHRLDVESRNVAVDWLRERGHAGKRLLVPDQLNLDVSRLRSRYDIRSFDMTKAKLSNLRNQHPGAWALVPRFDKQDEKRVMKRGKAKVLAKFGTRKLSLDRNRAHGGRRFYVASGNPLFEIVQL